MSFNRKQEDRKKRRAVTNTDKAKTHNDNSRNNERQKIKMGKWDV